jgi:hypothetical protein
MRHPLAEVAVMVVETVVERAAAVLGHPEAPLADDRRGIAPRLQELRHGDGPRLHRVLALGAGFALHVVAYRRVA